MGKLQVLYTGIGNMPSLRKGKWYDVVATDNTCHTLINEFGNECRYLKDRFESTRVYHEPKPVKVDISVKTTTTRVIFADPRQAPWHGPTEFEVVDETANYYFIKVPLDSGKEIVAPYRKSLMIPVGFVAESTLCESSTVFAQSDNASKPKETHTIGVTFDSYGKIYHYLSHSLPGDLKYAVVNSPSSGYTCVKIAKVYPNTKLNPASKYIVDFVDDTVYRMQEADRTALFQRLADAKRKVSRRRRELLENLSDVELRQLDPIYDQLSKELYEIEIRS